MLQGRKAVSFLLHALVTEIIKSVNYLVLHIASATLNIAKNITVFVLACQCICKYSPGQLDLVLLCSTHTRE